ncbi:MAG: hypothetical protein NTV34_07070 [Proteobacteria bacterium]|nr:hypothetical protein [Pseudomonadota bacterium]
MKWIDLRHSVCATLLFITACGETPSFKQNEQGSLAKPGGNSDSLKDDSNKGSSSAEKSGADGGGGSSSKSNSTVTTATSGGTGNTGGGNTTVSTNGGGTVTTIGTTRVVEVPGVPTIRMGIGFNDSTGMSGDDQDFNDAVVCFEGPFKFDAATNSIWSDRDQTIPVRINSISGCGHNVGIEIISPSGAASTTTYASNINRDVQIAFPAGSRVRVKVAISRQISACSGVPLNQYTYMENRAWFKIEKNVCRTTGS